MSTPSTQPTAGDSRAAQADRERDDHFARLLDSERDDRDRIPKTETSDPAPAQVAETPPRSEETRASSEDAAADKASAKKAFQAALNQLNADEASDAKDEAAAAAQAESETVAADTKSTAQAAASANTALLASAVAGTNGAQALEAVDTDTADASQTTDGSEIAALLGLTQSLTTEAVKPLTRLHGANDGAVQATQAGMSGITQPGAGEIAADANGANAGKAAGVAPPAAASAQTKPQTPAQAATQSAMTPPVDSGAKAAVDTTVAIPQAATQPSVASNPLSDAARATATPPALQSAPAATIEVYSRIIERADGRAQRFEVRLDPVELGRVDVRIEIGADKKVHAVLAAHDSAALSDLMRGQRALERALSDAGIDLADNGVRFEMSNDASRGGSGQQRDGDASTRSGQQDVWRSFDSVLIPVSAETAAAATPVRRSQRLDLVA